MFGTWRWNAGLGLLGLILTIVFSIGKNPVPVALLRSGYAFIAFFLLAYVLRFVWAMIIKTSNTQEQQEQQVEAEEKGTQLDLTTPDDQEDLNELLKPKQDTKATPSAANDGQGEQTDFKPLTPTKLVSTQGNDPEQLAKAVRHLTGG